MVENQENGEAVLPEGVNGQNNLNTEPDEPQIIHCDGVSIPLEYTSGGVRLTFPDRAQNLPKTVDASGERYENESVVFHAKADSVYLEVRGSTYDNCRLARR